MKLQQVATYIFLGLIFIISSYQAVQFVNQVADQLVISDAKRYFDAAQSFTSIIHHGPQHFLGYSALLAAIFKLFSYEPIVAAYTNIALSTISLFLIFTIAKKLSGNWAGIIASFLFAFSQESLLLKAWILTEHLQVTLSLMFISLILWKHQIKTTLIGNILIGLFMTYILLAKATLILFVIPFLLIPLKGGISTIKQYLKTYIVSILTVGILILSYGIFNAVKHDRFVLLSTYGAMNFYIGNNPQADGRWSSGNFRAPIPEEAKTDQEYDKLYKKYAHKFRQEFPNKVKQINNNRFITWWTTDPNQDTLYGRANFSKNSEGMFKISSNLIFQLGIPASFLFLSLLGINTINKTKLTITNNHWCAGLFFTGIAATGLVLLVQYFSGEAARNVVTYHLSIIMATVATWMIFLLGKDISTETYVRLLYPIGMILFTSAFVLLFTARLRYRFPIMPFYCISIGVVFNDLITICFKKPNQRSETSLEKIF